MADGHGRNRRAGSRGAAGSSAKRNMKPLHESRDGNRAVESQGRKQRFPVDVWSMCGLSDLVPRGCGAMRFVTRFAGARGVDGFVASLSPDERGTVGQHASVFGQLITEFLCAAAGVPGVVHAA